MTQLFEVSILVSPDEIMKKKEQQKRKLCNKTKVYRNTFFFLNVGFLHSKHNEWSEAQDRHSRSFYSVTSQDRTFRI